MPFSAAPGTPRSTPRIAPIDAVRGFALFGVLLVNMFNFGAYSPEWSGTLDRAINDLMHAFFETKSLRLFSLLFGLGLAMQLANRAAVRTSQWFLIRRLMVLFVFGMVHALLFDGDILMEYAMLGLILMAFQNMGQRYLLPLGFVLLAAFPISNFLGALGNNDQLVHWEDALSLAALRVDHPYLGTLSDVFHENAFAIPPLIWRDLGSPESSLTLFAMLLMGMFVARSGVLNRINDHLPRIRKVVFWGVVPGGACALAELFLSRNYGYSAYDTGGSSPAVQLLGDCLFTYGSTLLAFGSGAGIILLSQMKPWQPLMRILQNLGRMALTSYLLGTLMFTTLFYGYGFGQFLLLGPAATTAYALLFFSAQAALCTWWLHRFRFGPAEWLWRSLTYWKLQPMRL